MKKTASTEAARCSIDGGRDAKRRNPGYNAQDPKLFIARKEQITNGTSNTPLMDQE